MRPVRPADRANAGPIRVTAPSAPERLAHAPGPGFELERRAQILVADLEEHRGERVPSHVEALEEEGAAAVRPAEPEGVAEAQAHPQRGLELVAEARHLERVRVARETRAEAELRRDPEARGIEPRGRTGEDAHR